MTRLVGVNDQGFRVGQDHQRAKLSDRNVDQVLELFADGVQQRVIAEKMEVSLSLVKKICQRIRRVQRPVRYRSA